MLCVVLDCLVEIAELHRNLLASSLHPAGCANNLAARHAHHHLVTVFDKAEVSDGLRDLAHQALFELERGVGGGFLSSIVGRCRVGGQDSVVDHGGLPGTALRCRTSERQQLLLIR